MVSKAVYYCFIVFVFISNFAVGQQLLSDTKDVGLVIVSLPKADFQISIPQLSKKLKKFPHVIIEDYCENEKLVFFKSDKSSFFNLLVTLKELDLVYYLLNEVPTDIQKPCNDLSLIDNEY